MRNTGKRASTSQEDESNRLSSFGVSPVKSVSPASATSRRVSAIIKIYKNTPRLISVAHLAMTDTAKPIVAALITHGIQSRGLIQRTELVSQV